MPPCSTIARRGLGYSESAAARRIRTARCVARFPEVLALLKSNEVNLSTVAHVSNVLDKRNKDELLERIRGTSQRKVKAIASPQIGEKQRSARDARHISAGLRDEIFVRDGGRCTYVGTRGRRCSSRQALQVDHIRPVARGGSGTRDNLRLLCAYHDRLEAERMLGHPCRTRGGS